MNEPYLTGSQFTWTLWGLRAQIALTVPLIVVRIVEAVALQGVGAAIRRGDSPGLGLLTTLDGLTRGLTILNLLAFIVTGACFLIWLHHSVANLKAAGQPITATPGWAVGMWFVPFANLILPLNTMRELADSAQDARRASRVSLWWAAWIIGNLVATVATRSVSGFGDDPLTQATIASGLLVFSGVLSIVAAAQLIALTRFVQQRQDALPPLSPPAQTVKLVQAPLNPDTL